MGNYEADIMFESGILKANGLSDGGIVEKLKEAIKTGTEIWSEPKMFTSNYSVSFFASFFFPGKDSPQRVQI